MARDSDFGSEPATSLSAPLRRRSPNPDVAQRRLIFSINPGRSGSQYLAELLDTAEEVRAFHEPEPQMIGPYLRMINERPMSASRDKRRIKCAAIAATLRQMKPGEVYAETSHMFIKTFFDVVLEDFENVSVVILRRDLAHVLKSFIEMGYFSERNNIWPSWMNLPDPATAALPFARPGAELDQFDRCIAYLLDIEMRAVSFRRDYPAVDACEVTLESLNKINAVNDFFAELEITPTPRTAEVCGQRSNQRCDRKTEIGNFTTLEICRERLRRYVAFLKKSGGVVPDSLSVE